MHDCHVDILAHSSMNSKINTTKIHEDNVIETKHNRNKNNLISNNLAYLEHISLISIFLAYDRLEVSLGGLKGT